MPSSSVTVPPLPEVIAKSRTSFAARAVMTLPLKNVCSFPVTLRVTVASGRLVLFLRTDTAMSPVAAGSTEVKKSIS